MGDSSIISIFSLSVSCISLGISAATFYWVHVRKIDAVVCTLVGSGFEKQSALLRFSIANLGNRSCLVGGIGISIYMDPALQGKFMSDCVNLGESSPRTLKPGEILSETVKANWSLTFLSEAAVAAQKRAEKRETLFFVANVAAWNPAGKPMGASVKVATLKIEPQQLESTFQVYDAVIKLKKGHRTHVLIGTKSPSSIP